MQPPAVPLYAAIGRRIAEARADAGLRQADLAVVLGMSRTAIANIEAGQQILGIDRAIEIAAALGVRPLDLVPEFDAGFASHTAVVEPVDELEQMSAQLDEVERAWVEEILQARTGAKGVK